VSRYRVDWGEDAENELADIWTSAADRPAVTQAQRDADAILARDPLGMGIELSEGLYRIVVDSLIVHFTVDDDQKVVKVTSVAWRP
jgi:hypothetical protein